MADAQRNARCHDPHRRPPRTGLVKNATKTKEDNELENFFALSVKMGYAPMPLHRFKTELSRSISMRMCQRIGVEIYQGAAYHLSSIPCLEADQVLPQKLKTTNTSTVVTWKAASVAAVLKMVGPVLQLSEMCAGISRALMTPSESVIRVVASIIPPVEISYVLKNNTDRLYVNFNYVLSDEAG